MLALALQQHVAAPWPTSPSGSRRRGAGRIIWQGERIPYRQVPNRAADIANRIERNALYDSYLEAVEAINPLREEKLAAGDAVAGSATPMCPPWWRPPRASIPTRWLPRCASSWRSRRPSTSPPCAGSWPRSTSSRATPRGRPGARHPRRGLGPLVRSAPHAGRLPRDARRARHRHRRPAEHPARPPAAAAEVGAGILRRGQRAERRAPGHPAAAAGTTMPRSCTRAGTPSTSPTSTLPVPWRLLGDNSLTEGYGLLFERLVGEPAWLRHIMGMPDDDAAAFADFNAFWYLRCCGGWREPALPAEPAPRRGPGHRARGVRGHAGPDVRRALSAGAVPGDRRQPVRGALCAGGHGGRQPVAPGCRRAAARHGGPVATVAPPCDAWARGQSGMHRTWLRISGMITLTGGRSCVRSGPCSSAR